MKKIKTPQQGIVEAILKMESEGLPISKDKKIIFRNSLEWILENETDKTILANAYNLRGDIYMGKYPNLCESHQTNKDIEMKKDNYEFTHYWVSGFGWQKTIFQPEDFTMIEKLGENEKDGIVFIGINDKGAKHILKGKCKI